MIDPFKDSVKTICLRTATDDVRLSRDFASFVAKPKTHLGAPSIKFVRDAQLIMICRSRTIKKW